MEKEANKSDTLISDKSPKLETQIKECEASEIKYENQTDEAKTGMKSEENINLIDLSEDSINTDGDTRRRSSHYLPQKYQFIKEKLKGKLFIGNYTERRLVPQINQYRDFVSVSCSESDFQQQLESIINTLKKDSNNWIITGPSCSQRVYSLYITLPEGTAFNNYWFQVRSVRLRQGLLDINVKVVRTISPTDVVRAVEPNIQSDILHLSQFHWNSFTECFKEVFTLDTCKRLLSMMWLALAAVAVVTVEFSKHLGWWSIAFLRELGIIIERSTPLILGVFQVIAKIATGFYFLILLTLRELLTGNKRNSTNTNKIEAKMFSITEGTPVSNRRKNTSRTFSIYGK